MDPQQRYCVNCAARRGNGANPVLPLLRGDEQTGAPAADRAAAETASPASRAAAVGFFALLPIAVALGVVVGRSGSGDDDSDALLQALQRTARPRPPATTAPPTGNAGDRRQQSEKRRQRRAKPQKQRRSGKVVAKTEERRPSTRSPTSKPTKEKEEEDTQIVEENPEQIGDNYIKAQQNLPDVIVVGGEGGGSAPAPPGVEP